MFELITKSSSLTLTLFSAAMMVGRFFGIFLAKEVTYQNYTPNDLSAQGRVLFKDLPTILYRAQRSRAGNPD